MWFHLCGSYIYISKFIDSLKNISIHDFAEIAFNSIYTKMSFLSVIYIKVILYFVVDICQSRYISIFQVQCISTYTKCISRMLMRILTLDVPTYYIFSANKISNTFFWSVRENGRKSTCLLDHFHFFFMRCK